MGDFLVEQTFQWKLPSFYIEFINPLSVVWLSLVVVVVVVPLVLYKIHVATNHLVMEGDNLRHWYLVNRYELGYVMRARMVENQYFPYF